MAAKCGNALSVFGQMRMGSDSLPQHQLAVLSHRQRGATGLQGRESRTGVCDSRLLLAKRKRRPRRLQGVAAAAPAAAWRHHSRAWCFCRPSAGIPGATGGRWRLHARRRAVRRSACLSFGRHRASRWRGGQKTKPCARRCCVLPAASSVSEQRSAITNRSSAAGKRNRSRLGSEHAAHCSRRPIPPPL